MVRTAIRYSQRLSWHAGTNPLGTRLARLRAAGVAVRDLTLSNPTAAGFSYPLAPLQAALAAAAALPYTPDSRGLASARAAVAAYYAARGLAVAPGDVLLTCSTSEAYAHLFRLLANPGDRFLTPQPSYPLFDFLAGLESVTLSPYRLARADSGWELDLASLDAAWDKSVRGVLLVQPNNPTGSTLQRAAWAPLVERCLARRTPLIVDEVFADYPLEQDADPVCSLAAQSEVPAFVLNGLSKISALPQMKLGWIVVSGPPAFRREAMARLELLGDTFLSVSGPIQGAAAALLAVGDELQPRIRARLAANLATLRRLVAGTPVQVPRVAGGWYAVLGLPATRTDEAWVLHLLEHEHTLLHPGYLFDFADEAQLVASLLTPEAEFAAGIAALLRQVAAG